MSQSIHTQADEATLNYEVCDDVLERAGQPQNVKAGAYTVPSSVICIPLGPQSAAR
jgi:hypothetical protein